MNMKNGFGILMFLCCFVMIGGLLIINDTHASELKPGDEVVLQNTFEGRYVRSQPRIARGTYLGTITDGTRGTLLEDPVKNVYNWYKVRWNLPFLETLEGWTADSLDDCSYIASAEDADKRDAITARLFDIDSQTVDANTNHDYYGFGCEPSTNLRRLGFGLHAGLDVQTNTFFDPNRNRKFYSLTLVQSFGQIRAIEIRLLLLLSTIPLMM